MSKLIDSPFEVCSMCDEYVFLDQTYEQCAREHHCGNQKCPLKRFFAKGIQPVPTARDAKADGEGRY